MLTAQQTEIIKATVPALRAHGETITRRFYSELLAAHPELRPLFSADDQQSGLQAKRLAMAVLAYASNIDNLGQLTSAIDRMSATHVCTDVRPEHYPVVGHHLLQAIKAVLGEAVTPEILDAWAAAYQQLADVMIAREKQMYSERDLATA